MKNYFTHSGKQESREVTITDLDMGTFDYFCNPSIFGKMQGQGSAVKDWRALPLGATLYLLENARAGQCSKRLASAAWGATPLSLGKMQGRAVQQKLASAAGGATPLSCRSRAVQ